MTLFSQTMNSIRNQGAIFLDAGAFAQCAGGELSKRVEEDAGSSATEEQLR